MSGPVILGIGNPLFDLSLGFVSFYYKNTLPIFCFCLFFLIIVTDGSLTKKYNLPPDSVHLSSPEILPLFDEIIVNPNLKKIAGDFIMILNS
jgi:hypothetical protein